MQITWYKIVFLDWQCKEQNTIVMHTINTPTLTRLWSCKTCSFHSANTSTVHCSDINAVAGGVLQSRDINSVSGHIKLRGESWWTSHCSIVVIDIRTTCFIIIECNATSICSIRCVTCYIERSELTSLWRICKEISKRNLEYIIMSWYKLVIYHQQILC